MGCPCTWREVDSTPQRSNIFFAPLPVPPLKWSSSTQPNFIRIRSHCPLTDHLFNVPAPALLYIAACFIPFLASCIYFPTCPAQPQLHARTHQPPIQSRTHSIVTTQPVNKSLLENISHRKLNTLIVYLISMICLSVCRWKMDILKPYLSVCFLRSWVMCFIECAWFWRNRVWVSGCLSSGRIIYRVG